MSVKRFDPDKIEALQLKYRLEAYERMHGKNRLNKIWTFKVEAIRKDIITKADLNAP